MVAIPLAGIRFWICSSGAVTGVKASYLRPHDGTLQCSLKVFQAVCHPSIGKTLAFCAKFYVN